MPFTGKSIVITGGTTGIGLQCIKNLLERGAKNIAILDITDTDDATAKLNENCATGQTVLYLKTDVSDRENVLRSFGEAHTNFGGIDVVIGNAGVLNEHQPEQTIQINLIGTLNSTQAAIEFMGKPTGGNGGIVMNIASVCGLDIVGGFAAYTASKFGIVGLTRSYAADINENLGIQFLVVCPGHIDTPMVDNLMVKVLPNTNLRDVLLVKEIMGTQTIEEVGACLVDILVNPIESTVYIIDAGKVKPISIPNYWKRF